MKYRQPTFFDTIRADQNPVEPQWESYGYAVTDELNKHNIQKYRNTRPLPLSEAIGRQVNFKTFRVYEKVLRRAWDAWQDQSPAHFYALCKLLEALVSQDIFLDSFLKNPKSFRSAKVLTIWRQSVQSGNDRKYVLEALPAILLSLEYL